MSRRVVGLEIDSAPDPSPPPFRSPDDVDSEVTRVQGEAESIGLSRARQDTDLQQPEPEQAEPSQRQPGPPATTTSVVRRYFVLSALAVLLTVACPGRSILWHRQHRGATNERAYDTHASPSQPPPQIADESNNYGELQLRGLIWILLSLAVTEILFIWVVRSDPGYICTELMDELNSPSRNNAMHFDPNPENSSSVSNMNNKELRSLLQGPVGLGCDDLNEDTTMAPSACPASLGPPFRPPSVPRMRFRRPYCEVCQVEPPLRAHHCRACHKCVATFDHHCPLVGNCVGERNRAVFLAFLVAQAIGLVLCARVVLSSRTGLETLVFGENRGSASRGIHSGQPKREGSDSQVLKMQAIQVFVTELYVVPLAVTAVVMVVSHAVMVACNITTFEIAKSHRLEYLQPYDITDCPFSSGLVQNVLRVALSGCQDPWVPYEWSLQATNRNSNGADWWNHIWRNKYWSCC
jgi:DHHC palmitoyltransferase